MQVLLVLLTIGWFVFSFFLSHQGGEQTAALSRTLAAFLVELRKRLPFLFSGIQGTGQNLEELNTVLRRLAHVGVFAVLTLLAGASLSLLAVRKGKKPWPASVCGFAFCVFWSWADEATKIFVDGRHFAWMDVGLNAAGCLLGICILWLAAYLRQRLVRWKSPPADFL